MADLVWANAKNIDFKASNRLRYGLLHFLGLKLQYKTNKLARPNLIILFDYNSFFLVVEHAYIVCPTTSIAKMSKFRGTSVN